MNTMEIIHARSIVYIASVEDHTCTWNRTVWWFHLLFWAATMDRRANKIPARQFFVCCAVSEAMFTLLLCLCLDVMNFNWIGLCRRRYFSCLARSRSTANVTVRICNWILRWYNPKLRHNPPHRDELSKREVLKDRRPSNKLWSVESDLYFVVHPLTGL